jgi:hypothetical protein
MNKARRNKIWNKKLPKSWSRRAHKKLKIPFNIIEKYRNEINKD